MGAWIARRRPYRARLRAMRENRADGALTISCCCWWKRRWTEETVSHGGTEERRRTEGFAVSGASRRASNPLAIVALHPSIRCGRICSIQPSYHRDREEFSAVPNLHFQKAWSSISSSSECSLVRHSLPATRPRNFRTTRCRGVHWGCCV